MTGLKLLVLDVETAPHRVFSWGLWNQTIGPDQVEEPGYCLCVAAKWAGRPGLMYRVIRRRAQDKPDIRALRWIRDLITEADGVIHYNGTKFDMPTLQREMLEAGLKPPAPPQEVDLLTTVRKKFRFASNSLAFVAKRLRLGKKHPHKGMSLWIRCMVGDPKAWKAMERYNRQDVVLTERLYDKVLPWIPKHPNAGLVGCGGRPKQDDPNRPTCPRCQGVKLNRCGKVRTKTKEYQRYQCYRCGFWSRDRKSCLAKDAAKRVLSS